MNKTIDRQIQAVDTFHDSEDEWKAKGLRGKPRSALERALNRPHM